MTQERARVRRTPTCYLCALAAHACVRHLQDQWFVLSAILKDCFGVVLEEDSSARPACAACRRSNLAITLTKIY